MLKFAPLKNSFMAVSFVGLIVSYFAIYKYGNTHGLRFMASLGFAFILVFIVMIIASLITMAKQPIDYDKSRSRKNPKKSSKNQ